MMSTTIDFGSLPGYAIVFVGGDVKKAIENETDKEWKMYYETLDYDGMTTNFCNKTEIEGTTYYSLFIELPKDENWYTMLAHEVLHLCQFLCKTHHIDMIEEKESVAYLHTHLMNQIIKLKNA